MYSPSDNLLAPQKIHAILCDVLKTGTKPASVDDPATVQLTHAVGVLYCEVHNWTEPEPWHGELRRLVEIHRTTKTLIKKRSQQREYYLRRQREYYAELGKRHIERERQPDRLAALDACVAAADALRELGPPRVIYATFFPGDPKTKLSHIKNDLAAVLRSSIPDVSEDDCHRFGARIATIILGKPTSSGAVKKARQRQ